MTVDVYSEEDNYKTGYVITSEVHVHQKLAVENYIRGYRRNDVWVSINQDFKVTKSSSGVEEISGTGAYLSVNNVIELIYVLKMALKNKGVNIDEL